MEIPAYSKTVLEYIKAKQRQSLIAIHGPLFEDKLDKLFPTQEQFLNYIDQSLAAEFPEESDEKLDLEIELKNNAVSLVPNATEYEFVQYKSLLNSAELEFRECIKSEYIEQIPYSATLYSSELNAEVIKYPDIDKPIIFFQGGLFSANLMFCKLVIRLIHDSSNPNDPAVAFAVKHDAETKRDFDLCACYYYNYYLSDNSDSIPSYDLKTTFENTILAVFLNSISFFIYAHEVGHWLLKHDDTIDQISNLDSWKEEFEADRFAMIHLQAYCRRNLSNAILSLLGPIVFFRYRMLIEKFDQSLSKI